MTAPSRPPGGVRENAFKAFGLVLLVLSACVEGTPSSPGLSKRRVEPLSVLRVGEHWPEAAEEQVVGAIEQRIRRGTPGFGRLVVAPSVGILFKDEEGTGADRLMSPLLRDRLSRLASAVEREWPALRLRVTEAWDENQEHGAASTHYEGRAVDVTTSDRDPARLGRLAGLATQVGFDWVYFEPTHVHLSVRR